MLGGIQQLLRLLLLLYMHDMSTWRLLHISLRLLCMSNGMMLLLVLPLVLMHAILCLWELVMLLGCRSPVSIAVGRRSKRCGLWGGLPDHPAVEHNRVLLGGGAVLGLGSSRGYVGANNDARHGLHAAVGLLHHVEGLLT